MKYSQNECVNSSKGKIYFDVYSICATYVWLVVYLCATMC